MNEFINDMPEEVTQLLIKGGQQGQALCKTNKVVDIISSDEFISNLFNELNKQQQ